MSFTFRLIQENSVTKNIGHQKISNIKGSKTKDNLPPKKKVKLPPNVVGFEISSSDCDDDESEEENTEEKSTFDPGNMNNNNTQETDVVKDSSSSEEYGSNFVSGDMNKMINETSTAELEHNSDKTVSVNNSLDQEEEMQVKKLYIK